MVRNIVTVMLISFEQLSETAAAHGWIKLSENATAEEDYKAYIKARTRRSLNVTAESVKRSVSYLMPLTGSVITRRDYFDKDGDVIVEASFGAGYALEL